MSEPTNYWWVGVILSIFSAMFGSLGDNLIKLSYSQEDQATQEGQEPTPLFKRPLWWIGMICITVVNTSLTMIAYVFSDASLVIPFAGLHICFNILFAKVLNHENYTSRQVGFTVIILVGVTVVLVSGNHDTQVYTVPEMQELFSNIAFLLMSGALCLLILIQIPLSVLAGSARIRCLISSTLVGTVGACTQVFAKTSSECVDYAVNYGGSEAFSYFISYVAIIGTVVFAACQLVLLNRVLYLYNVFVVVPIVNSTLIIFGSLYGMVLFQEYDRFDVKSLILMPIGIVATALGVALLAWDHNPEDKQELFIGSPGSRITRAGTWGGFPSSGSFSQGSTGGYHPRYYSERGFQESFLPEIGDDSFAFRRSNSIPEISTGGIKSPNSAFHKDSDLELQRWTTSHTLPPTPENTEMVEPLVGERLSLRGPSIRLESPDIPHDLTLH